MAAKQNSYCLDHSKKLILILSQFLYLSYYKILYYLNKYEIKKFFYVN